MNTNAPVAPLDIYRQDFEPGVLGTGPRRTAARWSARVAEAYVLRGRLGRLPDPRAADPIERSCGRWVDRQRLDLRDGKLTAAQEQRLDYRVPGWRLNQLDTQWLANHQEVAQFLADHGRYPTEKENKRLFDWVEKQTFRLDSTKSELRLDAADKLTPGLTAGAAEAKWTADSIAVAEFHSANDRFPSRKSKDDTEKHLGSWLHNQRIRLKGQTPLARAHATALDGLIPGWRGKNHAEAA